jgi:two-component sensor histidine kinase
LNRRIIPGYTTTRLILVYFIVGLGALIFGFFHYAQQISRLNADIEAQIDLFADLAAEIPGVENRGLQQKLIAIVKKSFAEDRSRTFSFIITDAQGNVVITRGVDPQLDAKIDSLDIKVNENEEISLTQDERALLQSTLARMKNKHLPREIHMLLEDRQLKGYIYYGDAAPSEMAHLPFVITDTTGTPQKWQIWGDVITADKATAQQRERAEIFIQNAQASSVIETTPEWHDGYFYYESKPYYGLIIPFIVPVILLAFGVVCFLVYQRIKSYEHSAIWGGLAKETAHQLGTPLSSLLAWTELLHERSKEIADAVLIELAESMQNDLERLQKTTARFGMIGTQPPRTEVNLDDIFQEVQIYFEKRLPHISRRVEIRLIPHEIPSILANAQLLHWVFENLIRNSLDAMDKAEGWIQIEATHEKRSSDIVIRYADNGSGIDRENQRKIFEPGVSTKAHGWGLGLTVVQRIIREYHHGSIRIVKTSPEGTTFEIRLPVA